MSYVFEASKVATKAKLLSKGFIDVPDEAATELAENAWLVVEEARLPEDKQELGAKLYTAHLMWSYLYGGVSSMSLGDNVTVKAGDLSKTTNAGSVSYGSKSGNDPYFDEWLLLVKRFGRNWGVGLVVVR